jgi:hypothetical protein
MKMKKSETNKKEAVYKDGLFYVKKGRKAKIWKKEK